MATETAAPHYAGAAGRVTMFKFEFDAIDTSERSSQFDDLRNCDRQSRRPVRSVLYLRMSLNRPREAVSLARFSDRKATEESSVVNSPSRGF